LTIFVISRLGIKIRFLKKQDVTFYKYLA
jgi:hypothetical protein